MPGILAHGSRTLMRSGHISDKHYRMWYQLNCKTRISVLTSVGKLDAARIFDSIGLAELQIVPSTLEEPSIVLYNKLLIAIASILPASNCLRN